MNILEGISNISILHFNHIYSNYQFIMKDQQRKVIVGSTKLINIYIRLYNGNGHMLTIQQNKPISKLISIVNNLALDVPHTYRMMVNGKHIIDFNKSLSEYQISSNSIIHIEENVQTDQRNAKIDVCIYFSHQKFIIKCHPNETVLDLKKNIYKLIKVYPKDQLLLFNGLVLKNDKTLLKYKIKTDALICMHSFAARDDLDQILSDYDEKNDKFVKNDCNLLDSVLSLNCGKHSLSKTTLFRSDSMGSKISKELQPYQIQIRQKINNQDDIDHRQFNYTLFNSFLFSNPSPSYLPEINIIDSLKNPPMLRFKSSQDDFFNSRKVINNQRQCALVESITSFEGF